MIAQSVKRMMLGESQVRVPRCLVRVSARRLLERLESLLYIPNRSTTVSCTSVETVGICHSLREREKTLPALHPPLSEC